MNVLKFPTNSLPLKVIIVRNFFEQLDNNVAADLFVRLLITKRIGYQTKHERRFIPVNTHDYFAIHMIVCHAITSELILLAKIVPYSDCVYFNSEFTPFELKNCMSLQYYAELEKIVFDRVNSGKDISYSGGWTVNPKFKGQGMSQMLKDVYAGIHYLIHQHYNLTAVVAFGAQRLGSLEYTKQLGLKPLSLNGKEMPPVYLPYANNLESMIMWEDVSKLSNYSVSMAQKYLYLWESRLDLTINPLIKKAA